MKNSAKAPRKTPSQERAKRTVARIKETTIELLSKHRYQTITTNQIASEAGISIGSLYKYFPNKESLLLEISKDLIKQVNLIIKESVRIHHDKSAQELFLLQTKQLFTLVDADNSYLSLVVPIAMKERSVYQLMIEQLTDSVLLYLAFNKDKYPLENPALNARMLSMAVVAIYTGFLESDTIEFDIESIRQQTAKLIENMLNQ